MYSHRTIEHEVFFPRYVTENVVDIVAIVAWLLHRK